MHCIRNTTPSVASTVYAGFHAWVMSPRAEEKINTEKHFYSHLNPCSLETQ